MELVPHEFMGDVERGPLKVLVMANRGWNISIRSFVTNRIEILTSEKHLVLQQWPSSRSSTTIQYSCQKSHQTTHCHLQRHSMMIIFANDFKYTLLYKPMLLADRQCTLILKQPTFYFLFFLCQVWIQFEKFKTFSAQNLARQRVSLFYHCRVAWYKMLFWKHDFSQKKWLIFRQNSLLNVGHAAFVCHLLKLYV